MTPEPSRSPGPSRRRLRFWARWVLVVICAVLLAVAVRAEGPMVAKSIGSFGHLRWRPLIFAVAMETLSMVALGLMERRILIMGGLRLPVGRAVAFAYASNAMSASLPMVGSGAASAFTCRRLVSQGAAPALAGWTLILGIRAAVWTLGRVQRTIRRPAGDAAGIVAGSVSGLGSFAPHRQDVLRTVYSALRNWAFDLLCLAFSIKAGRGTRPVVGHRAGLGGRSRRAPA
jgi:uncharacterized membrane protein YbhN (UPF0104 family)